MSVIIGNLHISAPYLDMERFTEKPYCQVEIIAGKRTGESAEIEENKIYEALINLFDKEI